MNNSHNNQVSSDLLPKISLKSFVFILVVLVALYIFLPKLAGIPQVVQLILKVKKPYLLLALIAEFISYVGAAWLLGIILSRLGHKIAFWDRFKIGSIAAFAIHFFPLGSFGEGAVDYYFLRRRSVPAGSIFITLVLRVILTYTSFLILFILGLILVPIAPHLPFSPKIVSAVLFILIIWGVIYMIYLYKNKAKFKKVWDRQLIRINKGLRILKKKPIGNEKSEEIFDDIYSGIGLFGGKKRISALAILAGLIYWLGDILCFFFVFLSFGYFIHFGVLIFSYGVASFAGMASFIPGGLGVTEGILGVVLAGLGVPVSIALTSILVFRFFSFWIWIPVGLYSFISLRNSNEKEKN